MKKLLVLVPIALILVGFIARQSDGIYVLNPTDEVQLTIRKTGANQTAPWLQVVDGDGTLRFSIPVTVATATVTNLISDVATNRLTFVNGILVSSTAL